MASVGIAGPLARPAAAQAPPQPCAAPAPACNLIWNGDFEATRFHPISDALLCPGGFGGFGNQRAASPSPVASADDLNRPVIYPIACQWSDANERGTSDLFNACGGSASPSGVPCNFSNECGAGGVAQPAHSRQGYAGLFGINGATPPGGSPSDYREYIGQPVNLAANVTYYAEFHAALASRSTWEVRALGLALAPTTTRYQGSGPIPLVPVVSGRVTSAPGTWTRIGGFFTPTAAVAGQAIVGNFGPGLATGPGSAYTVRTNGTNTNPMANSAYYYIDDVSLLPVPTAGPDRTARCGQYVSLGSGCALPAGSGATYQWSPTTGLLDATTATPTLVAGPSTPAQYTLTVTLPGNQTHVSSTRVSVVTPPVTVAASYAGPYCAGSVVTLTASGGNGQNYEWSPATGLSASTGAVVTATVPASGTLVSYTVGSPCGGQARIGLEVSDKCCALETAGQSKVVVLDAGVYSTSPFGRQLLPSGVSAVYYMPVSTVLAADAFYLEPGDTLRSHNNRPNTLFEAAAPAPGGSLVLAGQDSRGLLLQLDSLDRTQWQTSISQLAQPNNLGQVFLYHADCLAQPGHTLVSGFRDNVRPTPTTFLTLTFI